MMPETVEATLARHDERLSTLSTRQEKMDEKLDIMADGLRDVKAATGSIPMQVVKAMQAARALERTGDTWGDEGPPTDSTGPRHPSQAREAQGYVAALNGINAQTWVFLIVLVGVAMGTVSATAIPWLSEPPATAAPTDGTTGATTEGP